MSDALTTDNALERTSQSGQSEQASAEAQAEAGTQESSKKVNLHDLPEYREVQSKMDRERAQLQQQLQREQQARLAMQQRLERLEESAAPDDYSRLELQLRRKTEEVAAYQRQLQEVNAEREALQQRDAALSDLAKEFGVPRSELEQATDYKHATKLAIAYLTNAKQRKEQDDEERRIANRPDIGGGRTSSPSTRWETEYEEAMKKRDSAAIARLLRTQGR